MDQQIIRYHARLAGAMELSVYIKALLAQLSFHVTRIGSVKEQLYEVHGTSGLGIMQNSEDIRSELSLRAEEIGIDFPGLVDKVTNDIVAAQEGERIVSSQSMHMLFQQSQGKSIAHVSFNVVSSGDPKVDECVNQYALLRFFWLANSIGMSLQEPPERSSVQ